MNIFKGLEDAFAAVAFAEAGEFETAQQMTQDSVQEDRTIKDVTLHAEKA